MTDTNWDYLRRLAAQEAREQERLNPPGVDPMYLTVDGQITRPSGRFTAPATGIGFPIPAYAVGALPPPQHSLIDGPPITDAFTGIPYTALRVTCEGVGPANGALIRFIAGAPYGGAAVERHIMVTAATPAAFMAGKYNSVRLEVIALEPNATISWEWFNDTSGVVQGTNMYTPLYDIGKGVFTNCPPGSEALYVSETSTINWQLPNLQGGAVAGTVTTWDKFLTTAATISGADGIPVEGPAFAVNNALPSATVAVQFRLTNL